MVRLFASFAFALFLGGCAAESVWAPDEEVARARYVHSGPPEIALLTSISDRSGEGAHSAVIINGSERVLFDPAGNWDHPDAPERHDVRHGFTPRMERSFFAFQAAPNFHAVIQRFVVSPEVAEMALQLAKANGAVPAAMCASATSALLRQLPGFESVNSSMYPKSVMRDLDALPGVQRIVEYGAPPSDPALRPNAGQAGVVIATAGN